MDINGRTVEDVLNQYDYRMENDRNFKGYYKVMAAKQTKFSHKDDDVPTGRQKLEFNLKAAQMSGNTSLFSICFYPKLDKNGELSGDAEFFNFRLNNPNDYAPAMVQPQQNNIDREILNELQTINGRLTALEDDNDDDDQEDDQDDDSLMGMLNGLPKETKQTLLLNALSLFGMKTPQPTINGVPGEQTEVNETEKIRTALKIMSQHTPSLGDDLMKLANIAQNNPGQFNMLLSMLRNG
jgi:hypothetical protein